MSLANVILMAFKWAFSIGGKLTRVVPGYTFAVVVVNLVSQVSMLLAFFLPLKVIILLSSSGIPRYYPESWQSLDREHLVIILAAAAGGFYLLNLLAEKILALFAEIGAKRLLDRSRKITLFSNQDAITKSAYLRYSNSLAGLIFTILAFAFIGLLYPNLAIVIIFYVLSVFLCFSIVYSFSDQWKKILQENLGGTISVLSSVGFLIAFAYMVMDFILGSDTSMTKAIVSLLLVRQLMTRLAGITTTLCSLYSERITINALFFHGQQIYLPETSPAEQEFWSLFDASRRAKWVSGVLLDIVGVETSTLECKWREIGIPDVMVLEVFTRNQESSKMGPYLIKLFHDKRQSSAVHEASLLAGSEPGAIPALPLLGVTQVGKYHCHLFKWVAEKVIPRQNVRNRRRDAVRHILSYEPPEEIVERYLRSKLLLWQRLDAKKLYRLSMITSNRERLDQLEALREVFDEVLARIEALPLYIVNPDIKSETLISTIEGQVYLLHWGRWSIEPIGAGWPVKENELKSLESNFERARECRESLVTVSASDVKLAALMFNFESLYHRQHYVKTVDLVPMVLECFDGYKSVAGVEGV